MLKKIFKYLLYGISWGCTCFVFVNIIGTMMVGKTFLEPILSNFAQQALGSIFVGICCASSAVVYTLENLARWKQITIHFAVGLTGYIIAAHKLKWMPAQSLIQSIIFILFAVGIFTIIWYGFYLYNKWDAKKVNDRLKELEIEDSK